MSANWKSTVDNSESQELLRITELSICLKTDKDVDFND